MNFDRTITIQAPAKSLTVEKIDNDLPDFDYEKERSQLTKDLLIKKSLGTLYRNFRKVFPNSVFDRLRIENVDVTGYQDLLLHIKCQISSSTEKFSYQTTIILRRLSKDDAWSLNHKGEVKCACPAFKYWVAHPDLLYHNLYGKPARWNYVRNMYKNPKLIPGICKHLAFLIQSMVTEGIIKP